MIKLEFDKFSLSQKICSVVGTVSAVIVYMADKHNLNIAIGIFLLTVVLSYLLRYKIIRIITTSFVVITITAIAFFSFNSHYQNYRQMREAEKRARTEEAFRKDNHWYAVINFEDDAKTTLIYKTDSFEECQQELKEHNTLNKESVRGDGRFKAIFNKEAIGKWYILNEFEKSGSWAGVSSFNEKYPTDESREKYMRDSARGMLEICKMRDNIEGTLYLISPDGEEEIFTLDTNNFETRVEEQNKEEIDKWITDRKGVHGKGKYYYVVYMTKYMGSNDKPLGIIETFISQVNSKNKAVSIYNSYAKSFTVSTNIAHKIVKDDGRFDTIFDNKPIGQWYIRWNSIDMMWQNANGIFPSAYVFAFDDIWTDEQKVNLMKEKAKKYRDGTGDKVENEFWIVSPEGEIISEY